MEMPPPPLTCKDEAMRRWMLVLLLVAGCGAGETPHITAKQVTVAPTTTTLAATVRATTAPPVNTVAEAPTVLKGDGNLNTAQFHLNGGTYRSRWQTFGDCAYYGHLEPGSVNLGQADTALTGETFVYNVKAGDYYVYMNTGPAPRCRWQITLERV